MHTCAIYTSYMHSIDTAKNGFGAKLGGDVSISTDSMLSHCF